MVVALARPGRALARRGTNPDLTDPDVVAGLGGQDANPGAGTAGRRLFAANLGSPLDSILLGFCVPAELVPGLVDRFRAALASGLTCVGDDVGLPHLLVAGSPNLAGRRG
jgi:hypothetical protein